MLLETSQFLKITTTDVENKTHSLTFLKVDKKWFLPTKKKKNSSCFNQMLHRFVTGDPLVPSTQPVLKYN